MVKLPSPPRDGNLCEHCVALCCRYFALALDPPTTRRCFEDMRWFLLHQDCVIFVDEGEWFIQINRRCRELRPDNRCGIYETRPTICREYQADGCDFDGEEYEYDHLFTTAEQLEAFAETYLAKRRQRQNAARSASDDSQGENGSNGKGSKTTGNGQSGKSRSDGAGSRRATTNAARAESSPLRAHRPINPNRKSSKSKTQRTRNG